MDEQELFALVRKNYGETNTEYLKQQVIAAVSQMTLPSKKETIDGLLDWIVLAGGCGMNEKYRQFVYSALSLLREQEARVLSWEEVDKSGNLYVWTEIHSFYSGRGCLVYCTVVRSEFFDELFRLREDSGIDWTRAEEDYNRDNYQGVHSGWRCWTARPTEEQRKAVPWNE